MYLWILLFVLGFAIALYFVWQKRELSDDEVVLPRQRRHKSGDDFETASELDMADNMDIGRSRKNDLEIAEEINRSNAFDYDEAVRKIHEQQRLTTGKWFKQPLERTREKETLNLNFHKFSLPRNIANDTTLEMDILELGVAEPKTGETEIAEELIVSHESQTSCEVILDPQTPADHLIHIGGQPERISSHEMGIDLKLSPRLIAFIKDPYWTYLYWNLPVDAPDGKWELRVKDLTEGKKFYQEIDPLAGRWYLHLNQPEHRFSFELGVWSKDGNFDPILASNEIQTPPDKPSDQIDSDWATVEELYEGRFMNRMRAEGSPEFVMGRQEKNKI